MDTTLLWDVLIACIIAAVPLFLVWVHRHYASFSDKGPYVFACFMLGVLWVGVIYASFIEPKLITTKTYAVNIGDHGKHLRVAVLSDLDLGAFKHAEWTEKLVEKTNALQPDLVLLAGNLVTNAAGMRDFAPLSQLLSRFGTYAVLGNEDYHIGAVDVRKAAGSYKVQLIVNKSYALDVDGVKVRLAGLDDVMYGKPDWQATLKDVKPGEQVILATHSATVANAAEANGVALTIAGSSRGNRVHLPLIGDRIKGMFFYGHMRLFVSPGVGESGLRARFLDPPEITLLDITL